MCPVNITWICGERFLYMVPLPQFSWSLGQHCYGSWKSTEEEGCYFRRVFKTGQLTSVKMELYLPQAQNFCGCFFFLAPPVCPDAITLQFLACITKTFFFLRFQLLRFYHQQSRWCKTCVIKGTNSIRPISEEDFLLLSREHNSW